MLIVQFTFAKEFFLINNRFLRDFCTVIKFMKNIVAYIF